MMIIECDVCGAVRKFKTVGDVRDAKLFGGGMYDTSIDPRFCEMHNEQYWRIRDRIQGEVSEFKKLLSNLPHDEVDAAILHELLTGDEAGFLPTPTPKPSRVTMWLRGALKWFLKGDAKEVKKQEYSGDDPF